MTLDAHGLRVELPPGWSGRLWARPGGIATLHVGNFPLALDDGEFGDLSTALMPDTSSFAALTEYRPGGGLEPGKGLFSARRIPRRLDPTGFASSGLAHPRRGQVGMQHFFTAARRPFCLYVVIAGSRQARHRQLAAVDHVLGTVRISGRG